MFIYLFTYLSKDGSHVAGAGLKDDPELLTLWLSPLNAACRHLPPFLIYVVIESNPAPLAHWANTVLTEPYLKPLTVF